MTPFFRNYIPTDKLLQIILGDIHNVRCMRCGPERWAGLTMHHDENIPLFRMDFGFSATQNLFNSFFVVNRVKHVPALSSDAVSRLLAPQDISPEVKRTNPGIYRWGSAWDANVPSPGPPESGLLISSHRTSAAEAPNMAGIANRACRPWMEKYMTYMCRPCCRWCSASAARPL